MLYAFWGSPIEVAVTNVPLASSYSAVTGQVIGVPSFARVVNSAVRKLWKTATTAGGRGTVYRLMGG